MRDIITKSHSYRFKTKKLRSLLSVLFSGLFLSSLLLGGCEEKIFNDTSSYQVRVRLSSGLTSPALSALVSTYQLTISAPDMDTIVAPLVWADGFVVGVVENIPAGPERTFTLECFDENLNLIYRGVTVAAVEAGQTVDVGIELLPAVPLIRVSPPFARLSSPGSSNGFVDLTIKIYNTPDITSLDFVIQYDPAALVPMSVLKDSGLSGNVSLETSSSAGLIHTFFFSEGPLVDSSGHQSLAVIRFKQSSSPNLPDSTLVQINSASAFVVETEFTGIFTDLAVIELTSSNDTGQNLPSAPQMPVGFIESGGDSTGQDGAPSFTLAWAPAVGEQPVIGYHVYKRINGGIFNRVTDTVINSTLVIVQSIFIYDEPGIDTSSVDFVQYYITSVRSDNVESLPSDTVSFVPQKLWNEGVDFGALISPQDCGFTTEVPGFAWSAAPNAVSYIVVLTSVNQGLSDGEDLWIYRQSETTLSLGQTDGFTYLPLFQSSLTADLMYRVEVNSVDTGNVIAGSFESRFWTVGSEGFSGITETDSLGALIGATDARDWCVDNPGGWNLNTVFPNPTFANAKIQFSVPFSQEVGIFIYDAVGGATVANPGGVQSYPSGISSVTWDLTDNSGARVPKGIYRCVMVTDGFCCYGDIEVIDIPIVLNLRPVLDSIGPQFISELKPLSFRVSGSDPDEDPLTFTVENNPLNSALTLDNEIGYLFRFEPDITQSGIYNVTFIVSDGELADTEIVEITVIDVNQAPVWDPFPDTSVLEGETGRFLLRAVDPEGDDLSLVLTAENLPARSNFTDQDLGDAEFVFFPDFTMSGEYSVTFIAFDGIDSSSMTVIFTVTDVNRAPVIVPIDSQFTVEGGGVFLNIFAIDPDGDKVQYSIDTAAMPANSFFGPDEVRGYFFDFDPDFSQAGEYNITFFASDGFLVDTELVSIIVRDTTRAPVVNLTGPFVVAEGDTLVFEVSGTDPDFDALTFRAENLPANASFVDLQDNLGRFDFMPDFTQAGEYSVTFIASDGLLEGSVVVLITVTDVNQAPVINPIDPQFVSEGEVLIFSVLGIDLDGDELDYSAVNLPVNGFFLASDGPEYTFRYEPDFTAAGIYNVLFIVSDGLLADTEAVTITVADVNRAPVLDSIGPKFVTELDFLGFVVFGSDPDGGSVTVSAFNLPDGAVFEVVEVDFEFGWVPDLTQAGTYPVGFVASDGKLADTEIVLITVENFNRPPHITIDFVPPQICAFFPLQLNVTGSDPDSDPVTLRAENLPFNATFVDNGGGAGVFRFTPDFGQLGTHIVKFIASDGSLEDTLDVSFDVLDCPLYGE